MALEKEKLCHLNGPLSNTSFTLTSIFVMMLSTENALNAINLQPVF